MKIWKAVILSAMLVGAVGSRALAQGEGAEHQLTDFQLMVNRVLVVTPSGQVVMRPVASTEMTEVMKDAKPMEAGAILFMHDGKVYMTRDRPAQNGELMSKRLISGAK